MIAQPLIYTANEANDRQWVSFSKTTEGQEELISSSLPFATKLTLHLFCDKRLCACEPVLLLQYDKSKQIIEISPVRTLLSSTQQEYCFELDPSSYCQEEDFGLFFYCFRLSTCYGTLFAIRKDRFSNSHSLALDQDTTNYRSPLALEPFFPADEQKLHPLTVYSASKYGSRSLEGARIYHVFVDRFAQGPTVYQREDAPHNPDWYNGIPEYANEPGGFIPNNTHFGGSLEGVIEKLPYIHSLGVDFIYLSPVFRAYSNHKYDTGNYMEVDELFGGRVALEALIRHASQLGIGILLDGVFNHTGDNSLYFNKFGTYSSLGAYQSTDSPFYHWFDFKHYPDDYESWWGVKCLPGIKKDCPSFWEYITEENGVIDTYAKLRIVGFRLDVVDELALPFLHKIRERLQVNNKDSCLIGEVWEDASVKVAYGQRRPYFSSLDLDGVIAYPFRKAILSYLLGGSAVDLANVITTIFENYPHHALLCSMNVLSTHDTERIVTLLGDPDCVNLSNEQLACHSLTKEQRAKAKELQRLAAVLQFTLPGAPTVYYGDEIAMEGGRDPFNRRCYPWGREDKEQLSFFQRLSHLHHASPALKYGKARVLYANDEIIIYQRWHEEERITIAVNRSDRPYSLCAYSNIKELLEDLITPTPFLLNPRSAVILEE